MIFIFIRDSELRKNKFSSDEAFIIFCSDNEECLESVFTRCYGKKFPDTGCSYP